MLIETIYNKKRKIPCMYFHLHNYMNCITVKRKQCVQPNTLMRGIGSKLRAQVVHLSDRFLAMCQVFRKEDHHAKIEEASSRHTGRPQV